MRGQFSLTDRNLQALAVHSRLFQKIAKPPAFMNVEGFASPPHRFEQLPALALRRNAARKISPSYQMPPNNMRG